MKLFSSIFTFLLPSNSREKGGPYHTDGGGWDSNSAEAGPEQGRIPKGRVDQRVMHLPAIWGIKQICKYQVWQKYCLLECGW